MTILRHVALAALPLLAPLAVGAAVAQTPPAPAKAAAPQPIPGVSPAGNAALLKFRQADPAAKQLFIQMRDTSTQIQLETQRPVVNVDLLATLLKKLDVLQSQFRGKQSDMLIQSLRALPPGDRGPFLKAIGLGGGRIGSGQAQTPPPAH